MIVGIDLGTTNSLVGVWRDGRALLIPNALGHMLTPSCISVDDHGEILVGLPARDRLLTHPEQSAAAFKRYVGTQRRMRLGSREFLPEELSALVLKSLKSDAEVFLGTAVTEAIITVPAYFNNTQRKATRIAGELAGLKVERLLNEPTAAALAYGLHQKKDQSQFLVFDLGGGTFDVSILEIFSGVMEVRASAGDNFLGGEDFVSAIVDGFLRDQGRLIGLDARRLNPSQKARLRVEAERVKRHLSERDAATFKYQGSDKSWEWPIDNAHFEHLSSDLLARLRTPVERALRDARMRASELEEVVLVGGATRMPVVHRLVARLFGRFPNREINPDEAIAIGAAVQAGLKARDAALREVVLTDVCPYTLGVETTQEIAPNQVRPGLYLPIIERNTVIPASRSQIVYPLVDNQPQVIIRVFQGEGREVKDNIELGTLTVDLPRLPREKQPVEIRFSYDINGLLEVEARIIATGATATLVITQTPGAMTDDEIKQSLASLSKLKIHPRDESATLALLARLGRMYEQCLGDQRDWVGRQIAAFERVLSRQDPREVEHARQQLNDALDKLEGTPVL